MRSVGGAPCVRGQCQHRRVAFGQSMYIQVCTECYLLYNQGFPFCNLCIFKNVKNAMCFILKGCLLVICILKGTEMQYVLFYVIRISWLDRITLLMIPTFPNFLGYVCLKTGFNGMLSIDYVFPTVYL